MGPPLSVSLQDVSFNRQRSLYKVGLRLQILTGLGTLLLVAWGWVEYTQTSDAACVGGGRVHPKMLSLLFLILSSIYCPCVLLLTVWRVCCVAQRGWRPFPDFLFACFACSVEAFHFERKKTKNTGVCFEGSWSPCRPAGLVRWTSTRG